VNTRERLTIVSCLQTPHSPLLSPVPLPLGKGTSLGNRGFDPEFAPRGVKESRHLC